MGDSTVTSGGSVKILSRIGVPDKPETQAKQGLARNPDEDKRKGNPGRPKGAKNKAAKFRNYTPAKWKPEFTEIVVLSANGWTNVALAERFQYSVGHISNILCTEQAEEIRKGLHTALSKQIQGNISERLGRLQEKALKRVEEFIEKDFIFEKSPVDAVTKALQIFEKASVNTPQEQKAVVIEQNTQVTQFQQTIIGSPELALRLKEGLVKALPLKMYDPNEVIGTEINVDNEVVKGK